MTRFLDFRVLHCGLRSEILVGPFLRVEKKASGTYLRILDSYRNESGQSTHRILHSLGKAQDYTPEQFRSIGIKLFELGAG